MHSDRGEGNSTLKKLPGSSMAAARGPAGLGGGRSSSSTGCPRTGPGRASGVGRCVSRENGDVGRL